jgi:hypothetical protein
MGSGRASWLNAVAQGFSRTYWDFFSAFGLFFSVFHLFAAVLAWQLGGLPAETLALMHRIAWALAICFVAITALSWKYAFTTPIVFSTMITVCLVVAARRSAKPISTLELQPEFVRSNKASVAARRVKDAKISAGRTAVDRQFVAPHTRKI